MRRSASRTAFAWSTKIAPLRVRWSPRWSRIKNRAPNRLTTGARGADATADGSILLKDVPVVDLRQSDFMFNEEPAFVAGVSDYGSWYVFPA